MANYHAGMVLTCTHEHCNCRVVIVDECHCGGVTSESSYLCACGAPLVEAPAETSDSSHSGH